MNNFTKYIFFVLLLFINSCVKDLENTSPIPDISLDISIPLQSYPGLQTIGNAVYFATFNGQALGYKSHGIYVIKTASDTYRSFDATCSYNPDIATHILLKNNGYECPTCKSFFDLFTGGVIKDPATYPLKGYNAILTNGQNIRVQN